MTSYLQILRGKTLRRLKRSRIWWSLTIVIPVVVLARIMVFATTSANIELGVFAGAGDPSGVKSFAAATGTSPTLASDYLPGNAGWNGLDGEGGSLGWLSPWRSTVYSLVLAVPIIPTNSSGVAQGTLAGGAAGDYDSYFGILARNLVSQGFGRAYLRLGWEFNGNWFPWAVSTTTSAADFVDYWRHIVTVMRSAPGADFKFVWNPNGGGSYGSAYSPVQTYPGNSYVDFIGTDVYDNCGCSPRTPQKAWSIQLSQGWGLDWLVSFGAREGKPIVVAEWGLSIRSDGLGLGDDPYFINKMHSFTLADGVAWTIYFNSDQVGQSDAITDGNFPDGLAAFKRDFG